MRPAAPKSRVDIQGYEYDWLGCDVDGCVALFSTAGGGYAPPEYLGDTDSHAHAIDLLLARPASTTTRFHPSLAPHLANTWKMVAERGLYAYDSDPLGGSFRLVAAPIVPVRIDELPSVVASVAGGVRLAFRFIHETMLSESSFATRATS